MQGHLSPRARESKEGISCRCPGRQPRYLVRFLSLLDSGSTRRINHCSTGPTGPTRCAVLSHSHYLLYPTGDEGRTLDSGEGVQPCSSFATVCPYQIAYPDHNGALFNTTIRLILARYQHPFRPLGLVMVIHTLFLC